LEKTIVQESIAALFADRVAKSSDAVAVRFKEGKGPYRSMTWAEFGTLVEELSFGLASLGLAKGETAAIVANTSHQWVAADLAILTAAGVSVPIYPTSSSKDAEHILNNSGAKIAFVHNEALLKKVLAVREHVPGLQKIILMTSPWRGKSLADLIASDGIPEGFVIGLEELQELGRSLKAEQPNLIVDRIAGIKFDDLATIIYTSGTTGTPKGVMLQNSTVLSVIKDLPSLIPINETDTYLSFLPLSHVFERVCGEFFWLQNGAGMAFAEGIEHVGKNIQEAEPTMMLVVPRVLDKIYQKVMSGIKGASPRAQKMISWALEVGKEVMRDRAAGREHRLGLKAKHWLAEKLVFKKLRDRIGGNLRYIIAGGAPATLEVIEFFNAIGINVMEGYGLTETAAPTNVNPLVKNKVGTVGPPLPLVEMKIADDGEILFRGPTIFKGYFKDEEKTKEAFTDGWFHTGDIGEVDKDGFLRITDRKKDLIVNAAGKNIAPQKIEGVLRTVPLVSQAIVFGDKRKTLVALLILEEQPAMEFAREKGWQVDTFEELANLPQLKKYLKAEIADRSYQLADYEQVRNIAILPRELSVESGELTATMKIKRNVLAKEYKELVNSLYKDESLVGSR
jgi:long-chain acyl-CoA synthetase